MSSIAVNTETSLSSREKSIARLLAWGYTQKEIADKLFVSQLTISTHLRNIYRKLAIHKETDLCRWWIFYEYAIADNPLKKIMTVILLLVSLIIILSDSPAVRTFPGRTARAVTRTLRPSRGRRHDNLFSIHLALTA